MSIGMLVFWAAVGWCGTPWRKWPPPPPPDPWWLIRIVAIIGGVVGGILFNAAWPVGNTALEIVASGAGALVGSIILLDLYGFVRSMGRTQATS